MFLKVCSVVFGLTGVLCGGLLWITLNELRLERHPLASAKPNQWPSLTFVRQCCLKDIRSAQEGLTSLSVEAQKVRMRLGMTAESKKDQHVVQLLSAVTFIVDDSKTIWDQLQSFVEDPQQDKRRQLRDIRIHTDGLVERFHASEGCCGIYSQHLPPLMKEYMQIAAYRVSVVRHTIESSEESGETDQTQ